jgi:hypothetical protein
MMNDESRKVLKSMNYEVFEKRLFLSIYIRMQFYFSSKTQFTHVKTESMIQKIFTSIYNSITGNSKKHNVEIDDNDATLFIKPELQYLKSYANKDKYFVRVKPWDWLNEKEIYIVTKMNDKPTMVTLDFWPQEVFLDATGQITVTELMEIVCNQYIASRIQIPKDIDKVLIDVLESLIHEVNLVEFRDEKTSLPHNMQKPLSKQ